MFKPIGQLAAGATSERTPDAEESGIKRVFMVMHGYYGNLFLSKFASGNADGGEDQGIANARKVWAYGLRDYDTDTIKAALRRCQQAHPEYPPSLPQFMALCAACKPREAYKPPPAPMALAMSQELREKLIAEHRERARQLVEEAKAKDDAGLNPLKRAIADAVACAGGDEVATLLRLDRMLVAKVAA